MWNITNTAKTVEHSVDAFKHLIHRKRADRDTKHVGLADVADPDHYYEHMEDIHHEMLFEDILENEIDEDLDVDRGVRALVKEFNMLVESEATVIERRERAQKELENRLLRR